MFNSRYSEELFQEYRRWLPYITDIYLPICDSETGDFRSLPFEGTIMDQPYMSMQILGVIQGAYRKVQSDKVKKIKGPGSGPARRYNRNRR